MKKLYLLFILPVLTVCCYAQSVGMSAFGYGAAATGGGSATPTLVSSVSALETELKASGSKVIIITQNLTFTSLMKVKANNKTLLALPGVTLTSNQQNASSSGILYFYDCSNLILRNLTFIGPGAYDCDGNDLLCFDGVSKAWVDHCDFQDGCDGNFDNKGKTDNVTVSWCRFRYLKPAKAGGSGGSDDHRFSNLLGSSSSDKPSDGTYNMTWAYCWWDNGCRERMLRCRNASLHFLNCYWNSSAANYYIGPENADCYIEGCSMQGAPSKTKYFYENYGGTNGAKWVNCKAKNGVPSNVTNRSVTTPSYTYTALTADSAVSAITDATCGAGATLSVTSAGVIRSACAVDPDDDTPGDDTPVLSGDTCFLLTMPVTTPSAIDDMLVSGGSIADNNSATKALTFGANGVAFPGSAAQLALTLDNAISAGVSIAVTYKCTSTDKTTGLGVFDASLKNPVINLANTIPSGQSGTATYTFKPTDTSYIGANQLIITRNGGSGGMAVSKVVVVGCTSTGTATEAVLSDRSVPRKQLRNGHLCIVLDNCIYDAMGRRVE